VTELPPEPEHAEVESLLGAYALDATDARESALVERHLLTCVKCATEVAQHHEVAGLLANSGGQAPPNLWDGIASHIEGSEPPSWTSLAARLGEGRPGGGEDGDGGEDQVAARVVPLARARKGRLAVAVGGLVGVAAVVVAAVLGVQVSNLHNQLKTPALTRAEQSALAQPSTRRVELSPAPSSSAKAVTVVLTSSGTGFVIGDKLTALPTGRTYQLWGLVRGQTISLGLLGRAPTVVPFSAAGQGGLRGFAITDEQAGGSVRPTGTPVVEGAVAA
jgi:Anti-sigma-K factor rskA/Putative zinc-finger